LFAGRFEERRVELTIDVVGLDEDVGTRHLHRSNANDARMVHPQETASLWKEHRGATGGRHAMHDDERSVAPVCCPGVRSPRKLADEVESAESFGRLRPDTLKAHKRSLPIQGTSAENLVPACVYCPTRVGFGLGFGLGIGLGIGLGVGLGIGLGFGAPSAQWPMLAACCCSRRIVFSPRRMVREGASLSPSRAPSRRWSYPATFASA